MTAWRICSLRFSSQCSAIQVSSEASAAAIQGGLTVAEADSRPCYYQCGAGFIGIQKASLVGSVRLSSKFQKKASETRQCAPKREVYENVRVKVQ